ncbi:hypothetical protein DSECCO2_588020 [anaerobic digester metagenome]
MVNIIYFDILPMGEIDAVGRAKLTCGDAVQFLCAACRHILRHNLPGPVGQRLIAAGAPAEHIIKYIHSKLVIIFRGNHSIATLSQIVFRGMCRCG